MMIIFRTICLSILLLSCNYSTFSQRKAGKDTAHYKHSIETSPFSPILQMVGAGIWAVEYTNAISSKDEIKLGLAYMNIHFEEGNTNSPALIIGYRRFLWKKLYAEYEFWPCYDEFYEKQEDKYYKGFDLWNEFRIGYQFDFKIKNFPMLINVGWPFGFGLYSSNKPQSFYDRMNKSFGNKYFYQFPITTIGFKF